MRNTDTERWSLSHTIRHRQDTRTDAGNQSYGGKNRRSHGSDTLQQSQKQKKRGQYLKGTMTTAPSTG